MITVQHTIHFPLIHGLSPPLKQGLGVPLFVHCYSLGRQMVPAHRRYSRNTGQINKCRSHSMRDPDGSLVPPCRLRAAQPRCPSISSLDPMPWPPTIRLLTRPAVCLPHEAGSKSTNQVLAEGHPRPLQPYPGGNTNSKTQSCFHT